MVRRQKILLGQPFRGPLRALGVARNTTRLRRLIRFAAAVWLIVLAASFLSSIFVGSVRDRKRMLRRTHAVLSIESRNPTCVSWTKLCGEDELGKGLGNAEEEFSVRSRSWCCVRSKCWFRRARHCLLGSRNFAAELLSMAEGIRRAWVVSRIFRTLFGRRLRFA